MPQRIDAFSGENAFYQAKDKARYGHTDWLAWNDKDGTSQARRMSPAAMKECLLSVGTKGRWILISASNAWLHIGSWRMGINILMQYKYGLR